MPDDTIGSGDANAMAEMCAIMDELHRQNQTLEDNIHTIRHRQQESKPLIGDVSAGFLTTLK